MEQVQIAYGTQSIAFKIERKARKSLAIEVHPDMSVKVVAPENLNLDDIKSRVLRRGAWIIRQQQYFDQFLPRLPKKQYEAGETHLYLGKQYVLKVRVSEVESVKLKAGQLWVTVSTHFSDRKKIKTLLSHWYKCHTEAMFLRLFDKVFSDFKAYNLEPPKLELRRMKLRWASYSPNGRISLNPELIKAPGKCIEYVLIHEICHMVYPAHNRAFYDLLEVMLPDWPRWKKRLEQLDI